MSQIEETGYIDAQAILEKAHGELLHEEIQPDWNGLEIYLFAEEVLIHAIEYVERELES